MITEIEIEILLPTGETLNIYYPVDTTHLSNPLNWDVYAKVVGVKVVGGQ